MQPMYKRQKNEIIRDILTVCNGGAIISNIMCKSYITYNQAKSYLGELIQSGLIEDDRLDRKFRTTQKGIEYLASLERMSELLPLETKRLLKSSPATAF
jgi:predicted transcriptional regulator